MKAILKIVVIVACIATPYAAIEQYSDLASKTLGPAEPFGKKISAKLVNTETELTLRIGEAEDDDEIRLVLESLPEKSLFQITHHKCGTRIGVKLGENGPYFCNLEAMTFAIESFEYLSKKKKYRSVKERIISFNLFFKYKRTDPTILEIPVFQMPSNVELSDRNVWARMNDVGLRSPVDDGKLSRIDKNKRFRLNFNWLEDLLSHGIYRSEALGGNTLKPGIKYYATRPLVLSAELVKELENVIHKYKRNQN